MNLTEAYRPKRLAEVYGQGAIVAQLAEFAESPYPVGFLFHGETGVGKTSMAHALAGELGIDTEDGEFGGFFTLKSGDATADSVRAVVRKARTTPMGSRHGWRMILVDEADRMGAPARFLWLSELEDLPPKTIVILTTNDPGKFETRFVDRLESFTFAHDGATLLQDAQTLVRSIWERETGSADGAPDAASLPGIVDTKGIISFRRVVSALAGPLRAYRARVKAATPKPAPVAAAPRGRHDLLGNPLPPIGIPHNRAPKPEPAFKLGSGEDPQRKFDWAPIRTAHGTFPKRVNPAPMACVWS